MLKKSSMRLLCSIASD